MREELQVMLLNHIVNVLLNNLDKDAKNDLAEKLTEAGNLKDFFQTLLREIPNAKEIVEEETEILFSHLTK